MGLRAQGRALTVGRRWAGEWEERTRSGAPDPSLKHETELMLAEFSLVKAVQQSSAGVQTSVRADAFVSLLVCRIQI